MKIHHECHEDVSKPCTVKGNEVCVLVKGFISLVIASVENSFGFSFSPFFGLVIVSITKFGFHLYLCSFLFKCSFSLDVLILV